MSVAFPAIPILLLLAGLAELGLSLFVLHRSDRALATRLLAAFLMLHAFVVGSIAASMLLVRLNPERFEPGVLFDQYETVLFLFLPPLVLAFSLSYPTVWRKLRGRDAWLAAPFAPSALVALIHVAKGGDWTTVMQIDRPGYSTTLTVGTAGMLGVIYLILCSIGAALVFWQRESETNSDLSRRRLRYMKRALAVPLAAASAAILLVLLAFIMFALAERLEWILPLFSPLIYAAAFVVGFVPPIAMAYGLLRYRVLDLDLRLRVSLRRGLVASGFVAVFFAGSELARALVEDRTQSALVGVLATLPLLVGLHPLQRLADRVARRALPGTSPEVRYLEFRRWEIYRATFEDLSADAQVTARDRRALDSLARTLGLEPETVRFLESQGVHEFGNLRPRGKPHPP